MPTLIGTILDVSGSMRENVSDDFNVQGGTWVRSIFQTIDDFVEHDVAGDNCVFSLGVGGNEVDMIDILADLKEYQLTQSSEASNRPATYQQIEELLSTLQAGGARNIRRWATENVIRQAINESTAEMILSKIRGDQTFTRNIVYNCLPRACRDWESSNESGIVTVFQVVVTAAVTTFKQATVEDVREVVTKAKELITKARELIEPTVYGVREASSILHGAAGEELTPQRSQELLDRIEPHIYGGTPLRKAINKVADLFQKPMYQEHKKLLFILSDGDPTDHEDIERAKFKLNQLDVDVVGCYIYRRSQIEPRKLHCKSESWWEDGAMFLYELSSKVPTQEIVRAVFIKRGWTIDTSSGETKLFLHVNHPDHVRDACELARNIVCTQDALSDVLVDVDLDLYINSTITSENVHDQGNQGTCYAHASAVVLHLAMKRILGRGHYPDFEELRDTMIDLYGTKGADTFGMLQRLCPQYRLKCREVNVQGAMQAIAAKRLVVAKFYLSRNEWASFHGFYQTDRTRKGILTKRYLDIGRRPAGSILSGHAVVLTSYRSEYLYLMNSYGEDWGDNGFFRVENADVLGLKFMDVYWDESDLTPQERDAYKKHGAKVAMKLVDSFRCLQIAKYTCPHCRRDSKVTEFSGTLTQAKCPNCHGEFPSNDGDGNILALNVYLTSLSR